MPGSLSASEPQRNAAVVATMQEIVAANERADPRPKPEPMPTSGMNQRAIFSPGVEGVPGQKVPAPTQVRYFNDADRGAADSLAGLVGAAAGQSVAVVNPPGLKAKRGTLEVWYRLP